MSGLWNSAIMVHSGECWRWTLNVPQIKNRIFQWKKIKFREALSAHKNNPKRIRRRRWRRRTIIQKWKTSAINRIFRTDEMCFAFFSMGKNIREILTRAKRSRFIGCISVRGYLNEIPDNTFQKANLMNCVFVAIVFRPHTLVQPAPIGRWQFHFNFFSSPAIEFGETVCSKRALNYKTFRKLQLCKCSRSIWLRWFGYIGHNVLPVILSPCNILCHA